MDKDIVTTAKGTAGLAALHEVAVEHATVNVPTAEPRQTAAGAREALLGGGPYEFAGDVAVVEGGRLVGLVTIERLLAAKDGEALAEIMDAQPPAVAPGVDQERVAWEMVHRGESSVGVVDTDGRHGTCPAVSDAWRRLAGTRRGSRAHRRLRGRNPRSAYGR